MRQEMEAAGASRISAVIAWCGPREQEVAHLIAVHPHVLAFLEA